MAVNVLGGSQQLIAGQGDIILFSAPASYSSATTLAQCLTNGASLGQVVQDSTSWDGEEVSFDSLLDEQGDVITSTATNGTHEFSFDLADMEPDFLKEFLGAETITVSDTTGATAVFSDGTVQVLGFGHKLPVKTRPIMITNDEGTKGLLFPKAKIAGSLAWEDKIWRIHVVVVAEYLDTANLKTVMPLYSTKSVNYGTDNITAETIDGTATTSSSTEE